jgi:hypothetical protein
MYLIKETKDLSTSLFATGFFVVHDTSRGGQDDETELTRWQQVVDPCFDIFLFHVESWRNNTAFVQTTNQLDNNLSGTMIINDFKFTNISYKVSTVL